MALLDFQRDLGPPQKRKIKNHCSRDRNGKTSLKCSERMRPPKRPVHPSWRERNKWEREGDTPGRPTRPPAETPGDYVI